MLGVILVLIDLKNYQIHKIGESFSFVAKEIYYDNTKLETVYNTHASDEKVQKNGVRCGYGNFFGQKLSERELNTYNGCIGKEYVITYKDQILPLYGVTVKREEHIVIWRDYYFVHSEDSYLIPKFKYF